MLQCSGNYQIITPLDYHLNQLYQFYSLTHLRSSILTGSYNNFFRIFDRNNGKDACFEASRESAKPKTQLKHCKVSVGPKRRKDEINVDLLDFNHKILHAHWHPKDNVIAVAATNNLYLFTGK